MKRTTPQLAADPRAAADAEATLERAVLLTILSRRPHEGGEHDDHAGDRDREEQDADGRVHALLVPCCRARKHDERGDRLSSSRG